MVDGLHLYSAFTQSALQYWLIFTHSCPHSCKHSHNDHARRQPARREQLGVRCLARGHLDTLARAEPGIGNRATLRVTSRAARLPPGLLPQLAPATTGAHTAAPPPPPSLTPRAPVGQARVAELRPAGVVLGQPHQGGRGAGGLGQVAQLRHTLAVLTQGARPSGERNTNTRTHTHTNLNV